MQSKNWPMMREMSRPDGTANQLQRWENLIGVPLGELRQNPGFLVSGFLQSLVEPVLSAAVVAWLVSLAGWAGKSAWFWILIAPVLYLAWLLVLLTLYTLGTTVLGLFYAKPARYQQKKKGWFDPPFIVAVTLYCRAFIVYSLPLILFFVHIPFFRWLILRSYATSAHLGRDCWIAFGMPDPDLTLIGPYVVIGDSSRIVAHSITRTEDGMVVFQSAPIELGESCTIGGGAQIELGAKIGARSIVEPFSRVLPFTIIPPGEVWGGNPAAFVRKREAEKAPAQAMFTPKPVAGNTDELRALVARALALPPEQVTAESSSTNCLAWDSLGKMRIGAALFDRFGLRLSPGETFALDSIAKVQEVAAQGGLESKSRELAFELPANPELLPLADPAKAITALMRQAESACATSLATVRIVIAATFVAEPVASSLVLFSRAFGMAAKAELFGFNQVQQALLSPDSAFHKNREGLNVVLVSPETISGTNAAERRAAAEQLLTAIKRFTAEKPGTLAVSDLPPAVSRVESINRAEIESLRTWWRDELAKIDDIAIIDFAAIVEEIGLAASRDAQMEIEASAPYSPQVFQRLGIAIARAVRQQRIPPKKVIALDCDGTLWGGVVGEDGVEGLQVGTEGAGRAFRAFQERLLALRKRGVLLVLVSKNLTDDVWNAFEKHPGMVLRKSDFAAARVNWKPKSENLRELAAELNLGLDSFAFFDDNPAERLEVEAACPQVTVVPLPAEPVRFAETLDTLWLFDGAGATSEDKLRNAHVQQDAARKTLENSTANLQDYLTSLELKVELRRARDEDLPRVAQLTQKTNQFNLSLRRRTLPEVRALLADHQIWVLSARDRFGDYGLVGSCIARTDNSATHIDTLLMSCRALGRGIEDAFLCGITKHAGSAGAKKLSAIFVAGPRNEPLKNFLERTGFKPVDGGAYEIELTRVPAMPTHLNFESL